MSIEFITAEKTWHVDNVCGDDANDGCTHATAWKTVQHAIDFLTRAYVFMADPTIRLCNTGTNYAPFNLRRWAGSADWFRISGDPATPEGVIVATSSGNAIVASHVMCPWRLSNLQVCAQGYGVLSDGPSHIVLEHTVSFNFCGSAHMGAICGGFLEILAGQYKVVGSSFTHAQASSGGYVHFQGNSIAFQGNPQLQYLATASSRGLVNMTLLNGSTGTRAIYYGPYNDGTGVIVPCGTWP